MKEFLLAVVIIAGWLFCTGCTSIEANKVGEPVTVHMPVYVKPDIKTKDTVIKGSAKFHSFFGIFTWGPQAQAVGIDYGTFSAVTGGELGALLSFTSMSEIVARNAAAYQAIMSANADIILAPQYVITVEDYFFYKSIECTVKGYPGYIMGVEVVDGPKDGDGQ